MLPVYSTTNIAGGPRVPLCANYLAYRRRDRVGRCAEPSCWSFRDAHERASKRGNDTQVQNGCLCAHARAGLMCAFMLQLPVRELLGFSLRHPPATTGYWLLAGGFLAAGLNGLPNLVTACPALRFSAASEHIRSSRCSSSSSSRRRRRKRRHSLKTQKDTLALTKTDTSHGPPRTPDIGADVPSWACWAGLLGLLGWGRAILRALPISLSFRAACCTFVG